MAFNSNPNKYKPVYKNISNGLIETISDDDEVLSNDNQSPSALTAKDAATVDATYGAEEVGVIQNNRTRIEEIETRLKSLGILP